MGLFRRVRCGTCGKKFPSGAELMNHEQLAHGDGPQYDCKECGESFDGMEAMRSHLQRRHSYG